MRRLGAKEAGLSCAEKWGRCPCSKETRSNNRTVVVSIRTLPRNRTGKQEEKETSRCWNNLSNRKVMHATGEGKNEGERD